MPDLTTKESPFTPGRPVPVDYFVARRQELKRLQRAISQAASGRNENMFITGPRGIGKTSLAEFTRYMAETEHNFVGAHCYLGGVMTVEEVVRVIFQRLFRECAGTSVRDRLKTVFHDYIHEVKLFGVGVEFTRDKSRLRGLLENAIPALRQVYAEVQKNGKKGLILILDDINGITDDPQFSRFLKSFVDDIATSNKPLPLLLVLVGIPERKGDLLRHQPSVGRIFDVVDLPLMNNEESREFFKSMYDKRNIAIDKAALDVMVNLSGGFPMLLHEIGEAVFWEDTDNHISQKDARNGILQAADRFGTKYIDPQIRKVLKSETYSSILWHIGKKMPLGTTFRRQEIRKEVPENQRKNLDNFLSRIKKLGMVRDTEVRGEYRFVNPLYHLYLFLEMRNKTA